ncbi:PadR family transcriptional regulator [Microbacterium thalassium]|uniref:DNA-binding PadR family transcriptional regulator n=1 Tax=Microbacterium thalassium TaxID=362649 RepID=A0A7X0KW56_9MICO|nr:helix-turn-helix transcriptional regulator [Microbacterium thalassium]MBB6392779.1 DNA-binding PadR family transcriptional regulator [Microbacterium thalassium]GLK22990.1 hypothetical protein GCM10017607_03080 [Microbacterium thalassium]
MQFLILGLLMLAPMSLYDLHKQFQAGPSLFYSASFGSLQRALRQLVESGLVIAEDDPDTARRRKVHSVTAEGLSAWRSWMREPLSGANADTAMLAKVYLLGLLPAGSERDEALAVLRASAEAALRELQDLARGLDAQRIPEQYAEVFRYQRATLDYGLRSNELVLTWLRELG